MEEDLSLWYDNAQITWKYKGQKLQRIIYGIEYACIYVIVNDYEMRVYDENGIYIRSIASPDGYRFFRFFRVGDDISVVCQGKTGNEDCYGRNDWKFKYKDKNRVKEGLVY